MGFKSLSYTIGEVFYDNIYIFIVQNWIITRTYAEDRSESQKMDSKIGPASDENFAVVVNMAKSLRREQLFISNEQNCFVNLHKAYEEQFSRTLQV